MDGRPFAEYRQVTAVDLRGNIAERTGSEILGTYAVSHGSQCVAAGNLLSSNRVPGAMTEGFARHADLHLASTRVQLDGWTGVVASFLDTIR